MIKIVAKQVIRKDCIGKYRELTKELVEKSQAEAGNIMYTSNQSTADERVHCFIEIWKDQEAIDIHNASEHFQRIIPQLGELFDAPEIVDLYTEVEF